MTTHSDDSLPTGFRGIWADFLCALLFLTRLPIVTQPMISQDQRQRSVRCFPLVGLVVGGLGAVGLTLTHAAGLSLWVGAAIGVVIMMMVTGGLHHDGLADVADGFGGGKTCDQKLDIMRDSRIGSYGVLALLGVGLVQVMAIADTDSVQVAALIMVAGAVVSRLSLVIVLYSLPSVRTSGLGASLSAVRPKVMTQAAIWAGVILWLLLPFGPFVSMVIFTGAALCVFMGLAYRQIKGQTGDVCGAAQQVTETMALLVLASFL